MKSPIKQFVALRESLLEKHASLVAELKELEAALSLPKFSQPLPSAAPPATPVRKKRKMSASTKEKIRAAANARWAKQKRKATAEPKKARRKLSAVGRANIIAAQNARRAKEKGMAAGK